jgi:hypothetical protein
MSSLSNFSLFDSSSSKSYSPQSTSTTVVSEYIKSQTSSYSITLGVSKMLPDNEISDSRSSLIILIN